MDGGELVNTVILACGCVVSRSMFGLRTILSIGLCFEHSKKLSDDMEAILDKILTDVEEGNGS